MKRTLQIMVAALLALGTVGISTIRPTYAATDVVTTCDFTGAGSLSDVVSNASAGDTITFDQDCSGANTIKVTPWIIVSKNLTVDGSGHSIVLDGSGGAVPFSVTSSSVTLGLSHITVQNAGTAISNINGGTVNIANSTIANSLGGGGQGAGIDNTGTVNISNSTFSGNSSNIGGAIYNEEHATLSISNSTFSNNSAGSNGGGAIYNEGFGTVTITNSTFSGNSAISFGGAIQNRGAVTIANSTFSGNVAGHLGDGGQAGAIYSDGTLTISASTFTGNSATVGGAIENSFGASTLTITNSTLAGNTANFAGAIDNNGVAHVGASIVTGNTGGNCPLAVGDEGYNLTDSNGNCGLNNGTTDQTNTNPGFVLDGSNRPLLTDNGGPTQTIALQPTSPAIDQIPTGTSFTANSTTYNLCPSSGGTDQRGNPRPDTGTSCDIGAYEYASPPDTTPPTVSVTTTPTSVPSGQNGYFNAADLAGNGGGITVNVSASDDSGVTDLSCTDAVNGGGATLVTVGSQSGSSPRTGSFSINADGAHAISCQATDGASNTGAASGSSNTATANIDGTAPTSTIQCNLLACTGLYSGPVSVSLGALDNTNGSGIQKIVYTTDGSTPSATNGTVYAAPFTVSSDTTLKYAAIDNAGNVEAANSQAITFLVSTGLTVSPASGTYGGTTDLTATLSPAVSGETVTFSLNGTAVCGGTTGVACPATDSTGSASLSGISLAGITAGTYPGSGSCDASTGVSASFAGDDPYGGSSGCNTLTVAQKDLHVTAVHPAISYGATAPDSSSYSLSYDSSDFAGGDTAASVTGTPNCTTDYTQGSPIGSYAITCAIGTLSATNYRLVSGYSGTGSTSGTALSSTAIRLGTLEVDQASPNFSFNLSSLPAKTYGDASFGVASYASSDVGTISFSTGSGSTGCTVDADGTVHITGATTGTNACVVEASLTTGSSNYTTPNPIDRSFSIAPRAVSVQASSPADQTFGSTFSPSVACTPSGFLNGDGFSTAPVGAVYASDSDTVPMTITSTTGAGTYVTKCTGGDPGNNYTVTTRTNGSFSVDKKPIQVTASHTDVTHGDVAPSSFTISYSNGWVTPDSQSSIVGANGPSCATTYTSTSSVSGGPYPITCALGTLHADNYTFVSGYADSNQGQPLPSAAPGFTLGTLGVKKADQTVGFTSTAPTSAIYGDTYSPTATSDAGLTVTLGASGACSYSSGTVTMTDVGTCTVTADQPGDGNFNPATQQTQVFGVSKKPVHVTASAGPLTYGDAKPSSYTATFATTDFVLGDNAGTSSITGGLSCSTPYTSTSNVGTYPITCTSSLSSPHYTFISGYSDANDGTALPGSTGTAIRLGTLTVNQAPGSVSIANLLSSARYGGSFTPTYTTNSTGTTSTTSQTTSVCAVGSDGSVSFLNTGTCTLVAHVTADTNHTAADGTAQSFGINPAIGNAAYIGQTLLVTSGTNSTSAQVTLSASVEGAAGDIATARVTFIDCYTGNVLARGVPVSPVAGASTPTGTANTTVTLSSGKYGAQSYLIKVVLDTSAGSRYTNAAQLTDPTSRAYATVTVVVPASTNSMQGTASLTGGAAAGTYGTGANVQYTAGLTYNKGGTNPQGQIVLSLDMGGSTYYIKSNSITSVACTTKTAPCKDVTVYTKASIYKIDSSGTTTSVDGNVTLRMDAHDGGTTGDTIGFTVLSSKNSSLYYSNNWVYNSTSKSWLTVQKAVSNTSGEAVVIS